MLTLSLSACFPKKAGSSLAHFKVEAPQLGEKALGSHTCPVYRYRRFSMRPLHQKYLDKAHFLLIYTLEAHPVGSINPYVEREWVSSLNYLTNTLYEKHVDYSARVEMAEFSTNKLKTPYPVVVDTFDDATWKAYGRAPSAAFVIDRNGDIALSLPWVDPSEIAKTLDKLENKQ